MKGKWKYILNIFIVLNIIYLGLYIYDKYIKIPELNNSSNKLVSNKTNVLSNIDSLIPLEYGDLVSDHILKDVSNNSIEIYRANEQFNFIYVNKLKVPEILDIDHLLPFIEIRKNFNNDNIKFIYTNVGNFSNNKKIKLGKIQKKFDFFIVSINEEKLKEIYKLPDCKCGYFILLDDKNQIRFSGKSTAIKTITTIISQELER